MKKMIKVVLGSPLYKLKWMYKIKNMKTEVILIDPSKSFDKILKAIKTFNKYIKQSFK